MCTWNLCRFNICCMLSLVLLSDSSIFLALQTEINCAPKKQTRVLLSTLQARFLTKICNTLTFKQKLGLRWRWQRLTKLIIHLINSVPSLCSKCPPLERTHAQRLLAYACAQWPYRVTVSRLFKGHSRRQSLAVSVHPRYGFLSGRHEWKHGRRFVFNIGWRRTDAKHAFWGSICGIIGPHCPFWCVEYWRWGVFESTFLGWNPGIGKMLRITSVSHIPTL